MSILCVTFADKSKGERNVGGGITGKNHAVWYEIRSCTPTINEG